MSAAWDNERVGIATGKNHRLAIGWFLFLTVGLFWAVEVPAALVSGHVIRARIPQGLHGLVQFSPAVAALVTVLAFEGPRGVKIFLRSALRIRVSIRYYVLALLVPLIIEGMVVMGYWVAGRTPQPLAAWYHASWVAVLMAPFFIGEELGWRGYFLDRLLQRRPPLSAALWVALIWGLWHIPSYLAHNTSVQCALALAGFVPISAIFTLIYWKSRSIVPCMLLHSTLDVGASYLLGPLPNPNWAFAGLAIAAWIVAVPVWVFLGGRVETSALASEGQMTRFSA